MDEIAHAVGKDPLDMRYELFGPARVVTVGDLGVKQLPNYGQSLDEHPIDTARYRRVLERITDASGWRDRKKNGRALGLAVHRSFLAYIAVVVSVVKDPDGKLRVDEAWICADAGTIVNLERVRSQLEGAVLFGLSHAMYGEITMKNGATERSQPMRVCAAASQPSARTFGTSSGTSVTPCCISPSEGAFVSLNVEPIGGNAVR